MLVRPRLVCIPSDDAAFAEHANALLDALITDAPAGTDPSAFAARLRVMYPTTVVRERHELAALRPDDSVWYVTRRAFASRIRASVDIEAPRGRVFEIYVERMPEWQIALRLQPVKRESRAAGVEFSAAYDLLGRELQGRMRIVDASAPTAVRIEADGMGVSVWYVATFRETQLGTRVEVAGDYVLPTKLIPATVERLVIERRIASDIERAHAALRELCTREDEALVADITVQPELVAAPL